MRLVVGVSLLGAACSDKSGGKAAPPPPKTVGAGSAAAGEGCVTAVDKVFAFLTSKGYQPEPGQRDGALAECRKKPDDPVIACVVKAADDAALEACMAPKPKGEPIDQLEEMTQNLRTYFFVHETFTDQKHGPVPAKACCEFPTKKCPAETTPNEWFTDVLKLDLSKERAFQYRFESTSTKAVIEAVGDLDCDGKTVTYRREVERRDDGNMHITVLDPPEGSD